MSILFCIFVIEKEKETNPQTLTGTENMKYKLQVYDTRTAHATTILETDDLREALLRSEIEQDDLLMVDPYEHFEYLINGKPDYYWY